MTPGWRPLTVDDLAALTRLEGAADAADGERFPTTVDDLESQLGSPGIELERMSVGIDDGNGALVGWCLLEPRIGGLTWNRVHVFGSVHPARRRQGLGRALLDWAAIHGAEVLRTVPARRPDLDDVLTVHAAEPARDRARLQERAGFELVRWHHDMFRDLSLPIADAPLADGYTFLPWQRERDDEFHAADVAAFEGAWGSAPWSIELWRHEFADDDSFRPAVTVGVEHDGVVVGYVIVAAFEGMEDDAGQKVAWLARLGVRPEHRQRGIGTAVITRVMALTRDAGFATAGLDVDTSNVTGALRLYERLGFVPVKRLALRAKIVRPAST